MAAVAGAALIGFGLGAASAQTAAIGNASRIAAADAAAAAPANVPPAAPGTPAAAARTAQGQPPIVEPPAPAPAAEACDDICVRRAADFAAQSCVPLIEAKAAVDFDWLSRPFGGMFTQAEKPRGDGIVRYRGDSIRILTQNQWLRYAYECAFDPVARKIVSVELRPGRLVPPAAVAQAAGAQVGLPAPQPPAPAAAGPKAGQPPRQAQAGQAQAAAAKPKPRRNFGEPSPISITQAHLRGGQVDTLTRIYQIPLGGS
jgi:hypothetical protein